MNKERKGPNRWQKKTWNSRRQSSGDDDHVSAEERAKREARQNRFENKNGLTNSKYGLVSRGQELILQHSQKEREAFFSQIVECFIRYCSTSLSSELKVIEIPTSPVSVSTDTSKSTDSTLESNKITESISQDEGTLELILANLRKLRELLIVNNFTNFTRQVFLFSVRISSSIGHYQSYFPSAVHLLAHKEHLSTLEIKEVATLLVLHLSHHNNANGSALSFYYKYLNDDSRLLQVLTSWIGLDYCLWIQIYNTESNPSKLRIMRFGIKRMVTHLVQCVLKLYFTLPLSYMDEILPNGVSLTNLEEDYNVHWKRQNNTLVIRERKSISK